MAQVQHIWKDGVREFLREKWRVVLLLILAGISWEVVAAVAGWDALSFYGVIIAGAYITTWFAFALRKVRGRFWQEFAEDHGWKYREHWDLSNEHAAMFTRGNKHSQAIKNYVRGEWEVDGVKREMGVFEFQFSTGSGKRKRTHYFTVIEARFKGEFPHIYLNNLHNKKSATVSRKVGTVLDLPTGLRQMYRLHGPKEYEIEVLQIFTPDVFEYLGKLAFPYDVELVGQEMLVFTEGLVNSRAELEKEYEVVKGLIEKLARELDRMKFEQIGHLPHSLRR